MKQYIRIAFTGDLMVLTPQLKASYNPSENRYDFDPIFSNISKYLKKSDYLIGNLETPLAGEEMGYTNDDTVFNTPDEFGYSIKKAGFTFLSIANNHCLDRKVLGLKNTIKALIKIKIDFGGGYLNREKIANDCIKIVNGKRIAIFTYTYGTNSKWQNNKLKEEEKYIVDLLREQDEYVEVKSSKLAFIKKNIKRILPQFIREKIRPIVIQDCVEEELNKDYILRMKERIINIRKNADIVLLYLHCGGQYNSTIGRYTTSLIDEITSWNITDSIIVNHPHCVLKHEWRNGKLVAYSLGNFCFTPNFGYYYKGVYADYSIVLNALLNPETNLIEDYTFYITKCIRKKNGHSVVYHVKDINNKDVYKDCLSVLSRFFNKEIKSFDIDKEEHYLKDFY